MGQADRVAGPGPEASGAPFAHAVQGENGRFFEGTGKEGARCMTFMMIEKNERRSASSDLASDCLSQKQFILEPLGNGTGKTEESVRSKSEISLE